MSKRLRASQLPLNLPQLQNLIKRDPVSYREEFLNQYRHFESCLELFSLKPQDNEDKEFNDLVCFLSQIMGCYKEDMKEFPEKLKHLMETSYEILAPSMRKTIVQALILLRNKNIIDPMSLLSLFFKLFRCKDKLLREMLHCHIITDIKNANAKAKNNTLNKTLQNYMYTMVKDESLVAAKKSLDVMIDLYRKNVWHDAKTVNVISEACFEEHAKLVTTAVKFFLGVDQEEESDDEDAPDLKQVQHVMNINPKKRSTTKKMEKALAQIKKKQRQKNRTEYFNFSALHLINDPQGFAERLYAKLVKVTNTSSLRFEVRLMLANLLSRLIGIHKLMVLNFYDFMIKYINPQQREVTSVLAYIAQASHELVPPESLQPIVNAICNRFVEESRCSPEVMTAGLNAIREICVRTPLAMEEDILRILTDYKGYKDKGVINAVRSLISLFREINPEMLSKKDRGRIGTISLKSDEHKEKVKALQYGALPVATAIEGTEALTELEEQDAWEEASMSNDSDSDAGSWVNVNQSDNEQIQLSDESGDEDATEKSEVEGSRPELTRILTPQDFVRLREFRAAREADRLSGKRKTTSSNEEGVVDPSEMLQFTKRRKQDYEERLESIKQGREGRNSFKSRKGKERGSTTNREKSKNKAYMMMVHKRSVQLKKKRTVHEKNRLRRTHIDKMKKQN